MTRLTAPLVLGALLLAASPASAWPSRFELKGEEAGAPTSGTLTLDAETRRIRLSVVSARGNVEVSGELAVKGTRLEAVLRASPGIAGKLGRWVRVPLWRVRVQPQGLNVQVELMRLRRNLTLQGSTPLGDRHAGNEALIRSFYESFQKGDAAGMKAIYASDVHFSDPVFPSLRGAAAGDMWSMLCESAPRIEFSGIEAGARYGRARWDAYYKVIGRPIHNVIYANFEFSGGKVVRHVDSFSFTNWSRQAYGKALTAVAERVLLSTTRMVGAKQLKSFQKKKAEAAPAQK